jgi:hypothetical protein
LWKEPQVLLSSESVPLHYADAHWIHDIVA